MANMLEFKRNVNSQFGEDGIIEELVNRLQPPKFYVEFGAWDGLHLSNVANLRDSHGWKGRMFELDGNRVLKQFKAQEWNLFDQSIYSDNINQVFNKHNVPPNFGVLSIDIDGDDYYVWKALDKKYRPEIVVIEFNNHLPNTETLIYQEQKEKQNKFNIHRYYYNCNLKAMLELAEMKGYTFVCNTQCNAIFVLNFDKLGIPKKSKEEILLEQGDESQKVINYENLKLLPWLKQH